MSPVRRSPARAPRSRSLAAPSAPPSGSPRADAPAKRTAELPPKVLDAMNAQLKSELASWYEYLAMAAWLDGASLPGASRWMRAQAAEEMQHAMRFYEFILDRQGRVDLQPLAKPTANWPSPLALFEAALAHEQDVTSAIIELHETSVVERDYVSHAFLQSFLMEQVEEEKSAARIVDMFRMAGDSGSALLVIDKELGQRGGPG